MDPGGVPSSRYDDHRELARAETVEDPATEARGEVGDVAVGGLVAERRPQRVVRVVRLFGRGQHQGQRLADVVHVGRAVAPDVGEEPRRRELRRRHRRAAAGRHRPARRDAVGVKQRHRQVADVVGRDVELRDQAGPAHHRHSVGERHGLRVAAGARREDHHERVVRADFAVRDQRRRGCDGVAIGRSTSRRER